LEFVAEIDLCTPRCDGDCWLPLLLFTAVTLFTLFTPGFGPVIPRNDNELPDREPSLSGYARKFGHIMCTRVRIIYTRALTSFDFLPSNR